MSPKITDLPPDLLLIIAETLLESDKREENGWDLRNQKDLEREEWIAANPNRTLAKSRTGWTVPVTKSIPTGSFLTPSFARKMRFRDALNLGLTCTYLYNVMTSYLFERITVRNTERSGHWAKWIQSTGLAAVVRTLEFRGKAPGKGIENFHDVEAVFPPVIKDVLGNPDRFPNLKTLIIDLDFYFDTWKKFDQWYRDGGMYWDPYRSHGDETEESREEAERTEAWRALVQKTFLAISRGSGKIQRLVYRYWPFAAASVFYSKRFHQWLSELESCELKFHGAEEDEWFSDSETWHAAWSFPTSTIWMHKVNRLNKSFLGHLNVTSLGIVGNVCGPIDLSPIDILGDHHQSPELKELVLGYCAIDLKLVDQLAKYSMLEAITFRHCFMKNSHNEDPDIALQLPSDNDNEDDNQGQYEYWNFWFRRYARRDPQGLQRITFHPQNAPLTCMPWTQKEALGEIRELRRYLQSERAGNRDVRVFPYACYFPQAYGEVFVCDKVGRRRALEGVDLPGWEALKTVMKRNSKRASLLKRPEYD